MPDDERKVWVKSASGARAIGAYVARMLDPVARARGFATTALLSEWPTVVGEELARFTMPDKVVWPRRTEDRESFEHPKRLAVGRRDSRAEGRRPPCDRGAASRRTDFRAGEHLFRLSGHRAAAFPAGPGGQGRKPAPCATSGR